MLKMKKMSGVLLLRVYCMLIVSDCVAGKEDLDANDSGTLVWDPKVVENLTDEECKYIISTFHYCVNITQEHLQ